MINFKKNYFNVKVSYLSENKIELIKDIISCNFITINNIKIKKYRIKFIKNYYLSKKTLILIIILILYLITLILTALIQIFKI